MNEILDEELVNRRNTIAPIKKIIYSLALALVAIRIWSLIYNAQLLDYDDNFGNLIAAFLLSLLVFGGIILLVIFKIEFLKAVKYQTIAYLVICSPFSLIIVILNYSYFFTSLSN